MGQCPDLVQVVFPEETNPSGNECGPSAVAESLWIASCGTFDIGVSHSLTGSVTRRKALLTQIRKRGGSSPTPALTHMSELAKAFQSYGPEFTALGRTVPKMKVYYAQTFDTTVKTDLIANKTALVNVKYGPIDWYPSTTAPAGVGAYPAYHLVSGLWGYDLGHFVVAYNYRLITGTPWVTIADPLADGRFSGSSGTYVVNGPQDIPLSVLKAAAGRQVGTGLVTGGTFYRTTSTVDPTTTTVTSHTPNPVAVGATVTVNFTVSAVTGSPTGLVTVTAGSQVASADISVGNVTLTFTGPGTKNIVAEYQGDDDFGGSTSSVVTHTVTGVDSGGLDPNPPDPCTSG